MRVTIALALWAMVVPLPEGARAARIVAPRLPSATTSEGQVVLRVTLGVSGEAEAVQVLADTPPFTEALRDAVRQWRLPPPAAPASGGGVLVAAVFRAPTLFVLDPLEPLPPPPEAPATLPFPVRWQRPAYPPHALGDGVVVLAADVDEQGSVGEVRVVLSAPGFDEAAASAAAVWRFRPARAPGGLRPAVVYLVFGFREPVHDSEAGEGRARWTR